MNDKKKNKKSSGSETANSNAEPTKLSRKKRILKITAWTAGSIFALLLLVVIFRDSLIKFSITRIGSWLTGVEITLDSFDTSLTEGTLHIKGLRVGNPPDFAKPQMVDLEELFVDIDMATLTSQEIVIETIQVTGLDVAAEFNKQSKFNVTMLADNLKRRFPPKEAENTEASAQETTANADKPALLLRNIDVEISLVMAHDLSGVSFPLPVRYSTTDLRIEPQTDSVSLIERLDYAANKLEEYCQACFNAGKLLISAGDEALETLKVGLDAGINSGKVVLDQSKDLLNKGKDIFDSAGNLFKNKK